MMAFAEHNVGAGHMGCESYPILITVVGLFVGFSTCCITWWVLGRSLWANVFNEPVIGSRMWEVHFLLPLDYDFVSSSHVWLNLVHWYELFSWIVTAVGEEWMLLLPYPMGSAQSCGHSQRSGIGDCAYWVLGPSRNGSSDGMTSGQAELGSNWKWIQPITMTQSF